MHVTYWTVVYCRVVYYAVQGDSNLWMKFPNCDNPNESSPAELFGDAAICFTMFLRRKVENFVLFRSVNAF